MTIHRHSKIEKVIRNGKVAVLYSPGFGAGWYSRHGNKALLFHPTLVELVEQDRRDEITNELLESITGEESVGLLGVRQLQIEWLNKGQRFGIDDYDGAECIVVDDPRDLRA